MSLLRPADARFHYSDGSHKWIPPDPDYDQELWDEEVRQHKLAHLAGADSSRSQAGLGTW